MFKSPVFGVLKKDIVIQSADSGDFTSKPLLFGGQDSRNCVPPIDFMYLGTQISPIVDSMRDRFAYPRQNYCSWVRKSSSVLNISVNLLRIHSVFLFYRYANRPKWMGKVLGGSIFFSVSQRSISSLIDFISEPCLARAAGPMGRWAGAPGRSIAIPYNDSRNYSERIVYF